MIKLIGNLSRMAEVFWFVYMNRNIDLRYCTLHYRQLACIREVNSAFHAIWLVAQLRISLHYSLPDRNKTTSRFVPVTVKQIFVLKPSFHMVVTVERVVAAVRVVFATKWRKFFSRHVGNSSRQLQQRRRDRLEFYPNVCDDSCDRLKTCRDGYVVMETEKRQCGNSFATIRGGAKLPFGGPCLSFKTAASCLYDLWVRN
jgi:hypothetical protein